MIRIDFLDAAARQVICNLASIRRKRRNASVCVNAGSQFRSPAGGGGVSSGRPLLAQAASTPEWRQTDELEVQTHTAIGNKTWVMVYWGWEAAMNESEHFFSGPRRRRSAQGQVPGLIISISAQPSTKGHSGGNFRIKHSQRRGRSFHSSPGSVLMSLGNKAEVSWHFGAFSWRADYRRLMAAEPQRFRGPRDAGATQSPRNDRHPQAPSHLGGWARSGFWAKETLEGLLFPDLNYEISKLPLFVSLVSKNWNRIWGCFNSNHKRQGDKNPICLLQPWILSFRTMLHYSSS